MLKFGKKSVAKRLKCHYFSSGIKWIITSRRYSEYTVLPVCVIDPFTKVAAILVKYPKLTATILRIAASKSLFK